jgi:hypothetical protein
MKALTVKQPWAQLICAGIKTVENRTWKTNFRGRVLIHASISKKENWYSLSVPQLKSLKNTRVEDFKVSEFPHGAIIGSVEIVDCDINHPSIWAKKSTIAYSFENIPPIYNWILANPVLFDKPIENVKGKLSFWESGYENDTCLECDNRCPIVTDEKGNQYVPNHCKHK